MSPTETGAAQRAGEVDAVPAAKLTADQALLACMALDGMLATTLFLAEVMLVLAVSCGEQGPPAEHVVTALVIAAVQFGLAIWIRPRVRTLVSSEGAPDSLRSG